MHKLWTVVHLGENGLCSGSQGGGEASLIQGHLATLILTQRAKDMGLKIKSECVLQGKKELNRLEPQP